MLRYRIIERLQDPFNALVFILTALMLIVGIDIVVNDQPF